MMEIIPGFVESLHGKVCKMVDLLEKRNLLALQDMVHNLAGTGGGYGFAPFTQPARTSEQSNKAGDVFKYIAVRINSLIELIRWIEGYDESKELVACKEPAR